MYLSLVSWTETSDLEQEKHVLVESHGFGHVHVDSYTKL